MKLVCISSQNQFLKCYLVCAHFTTQFFSEVNKVLSIYSCFGLCVCVCVWKLLKGMFHVLINMVRAKVMCVGPRTYGRSSPKELVETGQ